MNNKEQKRRGSRRKDAKDVRKPFAWSFYLSDNEVERLGGRDAVLDMAAVKRRELQKELDELLCG